MTTQTYRCIRHNVSAEYVHLVFVTKFQQPVFTNKVRTFSEHTIQSFYP